MLKIIYNKVIGIIFLSSSILFSQDMPKKITLEDIKLKNYEKSYFALLPVDVANYIYFLAGLWKPFYENNRSAEWDLDAGNIQDLVNSRFSIIDKKNVREIKVRRPCFACTKYTFSNSGQILWAQGYEQDFEPAILIDNKLGMMWGNIPGNKNCRANLYDLQNGDINQNFSRYFFMNHDLFENFEKIAVPNDGKNIFFSGSYVPDGGKQDERKNGVFWFNLDAYLKAVKSGNFSLTDFLHIPETTVDQMEYYDDFKVLCIRSCKFIKFYDCSKDSKEAHEVSILGKYLSK